MTKIFLAFTSLLFLTTSVYAVELDTKTSVITWKGSKITGDQHTGQIFAKSSSIQVTDGVITSGEIVFDMASFTVTDLEGEWKTKFLGHMKSPDFFDVAKFPTATLKVRDFKKGRIAGDLTIKGVTQTISFPVRTVDGKYMGKTTFDRTKFGMTYGSGSFFKNLGDKLINDAVEVEFTIALKGK